MIMIDSWGTLHFKPTRCIFMVKNMRRKFPILPTIS